MFGMQWDKVIAHVDMDAFYASIEIRDDPSLAGKPVVVGGSADGRGVVSAASYEARVFGVRSAMPMSRALRLCPDLVALPGSLRKYSAVSKEIMEILGRYSPSVQPLSLDEAFLDLTGMELALGTPEEIGPAIRAEIKEQTRLTASVGIAPVKFVAKIASDYDKPDGLTIVPPGGVQDFLEPLTIDKLWGVGPRMQEALQQFGIRTVGDIARRSPEFMAQKFGQHGQHLLRLARGEDARGVVSHWDAKSYSHEETFAKDQGDVETLESVLLDQALRVARRLRRDDVAGRVINLKLRYPPFVTLTRRTTIDERTNDADRIFDVVRKLFHAEWNGKPVRLLGVGVSGIGEEYGGTLDLFDPEPLRQRRDALTDTVHDLEDRFGRGKITRAGALRKRSVRDTGTMNDKPTDPE